MYLLTNKDKREVAIPAPRGAVILAVGATAEVTDDHYRELLKSRSALTRGTVTAEYRADPTPKEKRAQRGVKLVSQKGGWWRVYVNDHEVTDSAVRKYEAERIAEEYS
jgi:hypothetical protein